jgi:hypothetical protein
MSTLIRPEISKRNKYYIDKHRHYELKHFCLQYQTWKKIYNDLNTAGMSLSAFERIPTSNIPGDPTARRATLKAYYAEKINLIEKVAKETDRYLCDYILKAVTEGLSYTYLKSRLEIPCGKDMYYDRYRRFFWLLSEFRG